MGKLTLGLSGDGLNRIVVKTGDGQVCDSLEELAAAVAAAPAAVRESTVDCETVRAEARSRFGGGNRWYQGPSKGQ